MRSNRALPNSLVLAAILIPWSLGCGGADPRPATVPVSGKVTFNGKPLTLGTVAFVPTGSKQSRPATGELDSSGAYKLMTYEPGDGAHPGDYKVSVSAFEGANPLDKVEGKPILPQKYYRADTSGLTATIKPDSSSETIDFTLEGAP